MKRLEENKVLLAALRDEYVAASARKRAFEQSLPTEGREVAVLAPWKAALAVQVKRIEEIRREREQLVLRSPVSGQVGRVLSRAGDSVVAGEPVLTVSLGFATEVIGYLPAHSPRMATESMRAVLARQSDSPVSAESAVLRVSSSIEVIPERLWRRPDVPEYGRAFVVAAAQALELIPGEDVSIRLLPDR